MPQRLPGTVTHVEEKPTRHRRSAGIAGLTSVTVMGALCPDLGNERRDPKTHANVKIDSSAIAIRWPFCSNAQQVPQLFWRWAKLARSVEIRTSLSRASSLYQLLPRCQPASFAACFCPNPSRSWYWRTLAALRSVLAIRPQHNRRWPGSDARNPHPNSRPRLRRQGIPRQRCGGVSRGLAQGRRACNDADDDEAAYKAARLLAEAVGIRLED